MCTFLVLCTAGSVPVWVSWPITSLPQRIRPNGCATSVSLPSTYPPSGWCQLNHETPVLDQSCTHTFIWSSIIYPIPSLFMHFRTQIFSLCLVIFFTVIKRFNIIIIQGELYTMPHMNIMTCPLLRFGATINFFPCPIPLKCGCWDLGFA